MPISGKEVFGFKWFYRPELVPLVRVARSEQEEYDWESLHSILSEIDSRHWSAIRQLLIEAKQNAELNLRIDAIIKDSRLSAYYQGWLVHADYILANFERIRAGERFESGQAAPPHTTEEVR
jgi:hypothetical protein